MPGIVEKVHSNSYLLAAAIFFIHIYISLLLNIYILGDSMTQDKLHYQLSSFQQKVNKHTILLKQMSLVQGMNDLGFVRGRLSSKYRNQWE